MSPQVSVWTTSDNFTDEIGDDCHELEVSGGEEPKILMKKPSMQTEKRISVDPVSVRALAVSSIQNQSDLAVPLQPLNTKFVSCSLPGSAITSPRSRISVSKRKTENKENGETSPLETGKLDELSLSLVHNAAMAFRRSKSCGEGRACAPSLDFDFCKPKTLHINDANKLHQSSLSSKSLSSKSHGSFFSKTNKSFKSINSFEDGFKCGALCLYLPGFGKGRPVRSSRKDGSFPRVTTMTSSRTTSLGDTTVISARASLEKFECGSWASSTLIHEEGSEAGAHFFDLPLELIKGNGGHYEPVSAAFLFEKEPLEKETNGVFLLDKQPSDPEIKGVLKTSCSKSRRSTESPRHVRFSTSSPVSYPASPSCATPRLHIATEDFNAFLEAQTLPI